MKTERNILIAFILNMIFSIFEFVGGIFTGSVAIISDSIHDFGDAVSIGVSYLLEKKSKKQTDDKYTFGYMRYSLLGAFITSFILLSGSTIVIYNAFLRILSPVPINYDGMIIFGVAGVIINSVAAVFTHGGESINQKAVNLHMLEDVFGWIAVLIGAIVMKFTQISIIDSVLSVIIAVVIIVNAFKNLKEIFDIVMVKAPDSISVDEIKEHILKIDGVNDIHHIHLWSMDAGKHYISMHVVSHADVQKIKKSIKDELRELGICHSTLEFEDENEHCCEIDCHIDVDSLNNHSHHHHHHHH